MRFFCHVRISVGYMIPGVIPNQVMTKQTFFQTEPFFMAAVFPEAEAFSVQNIAICDTVEKPC